MRELSEISRLVLDTSVLIEYIVENAPYRNIVVDLFNRAKRGEVNLIVNSVTLGETLYIASRIYKHAGISNPNAEALNYVLWVKSLVKVVENDYEIAITAGELKKELHLSLADCFVIATGKVMEAISLFRSVENEMRSILGKLRKLNVLFLSEVFVARDRA